MAAAPVLTLAGNEITDALRTAQGPVDGSLPATLGGVGIYPAHTNAATQTDFQTALANWIGASATLTGQFTEGSEVFPAHKSLKAVATLANGGAEFATTSCPAGVAGDTWTISCWVKGPVGQSGWLKIQGLTGANAQTEVFTSPNFVYTGARQRVTFTATLAAGTTVKVRPIIGTVTNATTFYLEAPMFAKTNVDVPYIANTSAVALSTATRAAGRVQAPTAGLLGGTQGWVAMLIDPAFSQAAAAAGTYYLFEWRTDANNRIFADIASDGTIRVINVSGGVTTSLNINPAFTWNATDKILVVVAWDAANIYGSVSGSAFATATPAARAIPTGALADMGSQNGASTWLGGGVPWCAFGAGDGTKINPADLFGLLIAGQQPTPDTLNRRYTGAGSTASWPAVDTTLKVATSGVVARASFNCYVSWSAWNLGLLTFDRSTFDGSDVFAVSPLDSTFQGPYDDISKLFNGYAATRGRTTNLDQVAAGGCNIDIRDPNGLYNPENPAGPLYGQLEDRLHPVKITATNEGATTTRFYGWVRRFHWEPEGRRGITRLECVDLFYWLDRANPTIVSTGSTTTGGAIGKILDAIGATDPAMRDLDVGDTIPDFSADGSQSALTLIQGLLQAERGMFFVSAAGKATYRSRSARLAKTSSYTFVDRMQSPSPGVDWDQAYDRVTVVRTQSGHTAVATDAATVNKTGYNDLPEISTPYLSSDSQADALAIWVLSQNKDSKPPMQDFTIDSRDLDLLEQQLARELVDRITVQAARGGTSGDFHIEQIVETLDGTNGRLTSQYLLSKVSTVPLAMFDSATFAGTYEFAY